jgi:hypothetical protein
LSGYIKPNIRPVKTKLNYINLNNTAVVLVSQKIVLTFKPNEFKFQALFSKSGFKTLSIQLPLFSQAQSVVLNPIYIL